MTTKTTEAFTQKAANRQQKKPLSFMLQSGKTTQRRIWQQKGWTGFTDQKESSEYEYFDVEPFVILSISQGQFLSTELPPASTSDFTRPQLSPDYSQLPSHDQCNCNHCN